MRITAEVRWFWPGTLPKDFRDWFIGAAWPVPAVSETRTDQYLLERGPDDLGIKKRGGAGIEIKGLVEQRRTVVSLAGCECQIEIWCKWPTASIKLSHATLVHLTKRRWSRQFQVGASDCAEISTRSDAKRDSGCDVEIAALLAPDGTDWWSFGLESFGLLDEVETNLLATACRIEEKGPPRLADGLPCGYPAWLRSFPPSARPIDVIA